MQPNWASSLPNESACGGIHGWLTGLDTRQARAAQLDVESRSIVIALGQGETAPVLRLKSHELLNRPHTLRIGLESHCQQRGTRTLSWY